MNLVVRNHLRSVENSLEHLPLFVIGNFFLVWNTDEDGQNASDTLLGEEVLFIAASVAISALSAIRGQVSLVEGFKNGAIGITGKAILAAYFTIGSLSRFLTFASLYQDYIFIENFFPDSPSKRVAILLSSTVLPFWLHFLGSVSLQSFLFGDCLKIEMPQKLLYALWSFICPPLFFDWELIHRGSGYTMPIRKCFKRSMAFFACHNILIFVETMLFSIPIFVFKNDQETNMWSDIIETIA